MGFGVKGLRFRVHLGFRRKIQARILPQPFQSWASRFFLQSLQGFTVSTSVLLFIVFMAFCVLEGFFLVLMVLTSFYIKGLVYLRVDHRFIGP